MKQSKHHISVFQLFFLLMPFVYTACTATSPNSNLHESRAMHNAINGAVQNNTYEQDYRIRPGDEIEILVWEQPNFNTITRVSGLGTIAIPLVGELLVSGLTKDELTRELERKLSEFIRGDMNLTVSIRNTDSLLVSVFGMVSRPDNYPVTDQTSVFKILSIAGGPTQDADLRSVKIYHHNSNPNTSNLDLTHYLETGQMNSPSIVVRPGDIVYVPRKENAVREMSEFLRDIVILFGIFRVFN